MAVPATDDRFSLKDHLFNAGSIGDLAAEYAAALPGFDADAFQGLVLAGLPGRGLLERLDWIADCLEPYLARDFPAMADQVQAAMPPPLDPDLRDGDFGRFIHAIPGILAVRHGLEDHRDRALDLLHAATQRFSMEFYIRPFLNRWPEQTLARLARWAEDPNYHVRRLVSEGTRPRLPWARAVDLSPDQTLPLLDLLHADRARYVTRSVANHLNDLSRTVPDAVLDRLDAWAQAAQQDKRELDWMTRQALRTLIKAGAPDALRRLGYDPEAVLDCRLVLRSGAVRIGDKLDFTVHLTAPRPTPVLVDYVVHLPGPNGLRRKVFKLKQARIPRDAALDLSKSHRLKADATTYTLVPGSARIDIQVNGTIRAEARFDLVL